MSKHLSALLLTLGLVGLLMASVQAQPYPAIVLKDGTIAGVNTGPGDEGLTAMASADLDWLLCDACGTCDGDGYDEEIRYLFVGTYSGNFNQSIHGPVHTIVYPNGSNPCTDTIGYGTPNLSWEFRIQGNRNTDRIRIAGPLEDYTGTCSSGYWSFNLVIDDNGMKGPRIECYEYEPD